MEVWLHVFAQKFTFNGAFITETPLHGRIQEVSYNQIPKPSQLAGFCLVEETSFSQSIFIFKKRFWTPMQRMSFYKFIELFYYNTEAHIQYSTLMSLYTQIFCKVILHLIIMLTLQYRHTEINKRSISLNRVRMRLTLS